jgi:hypothetical protein
MVGVRTFIGTGELVCDVCIWVCGAERKLRPATTRVERCLVEKRDTPSPVSVMIRVAILGALLLFLLSPDARSQDRPPAIEVQFHRAEAAWKTGASLHEAKARIDRVLEELPERCRCSQACARRCFSRLAARPRHSSMRCVRSRYDRPTPRRALSFAKSPSLPTRQTLARRELNAASELIIDNADFNLAAIRQRNTTRASSIEARPLRAQHSISLHGVPRSYYQLARVFVLRGQADEAVAVLERGFRGASARCCSRSR